MDFYLCFNNLFFELLFNICYTFFGDYMRYFVISDIHGNGNLYYSVIGYLKNISKIENITLFINGDLIDRGIESGEVLLDVMNIIKKNDKHFKIVYLGGNHELLMYQFYEKKKNKEEISYFNNWYDNGGFVTDFALQDILKEEEKILEIVDFISNLDLYYKFRKKINNQNIVLVHAACPKSVEKSCDLKIKNNYNSIENLVWSRGNSSYIGNSNYFSIVGHSPNNNKFGYFYNPSGNYLNIDGGSACYVSGLFEYDHYPLVEIKDNYLKILTFNNNNEIIYGNYFKDYKSVPLSEDEINVERELLNKDIKSKRLIKLPDNIIGYDDWR